MTQSTSHPFSQGVLMQVLSLHYDEILIEESRQRKEFDAQKLLELASSITSNGLIHPVVVRQNEDKEYVLVAGERRIRALHYVWNYNEKGFKVTCGDYLFDENYVPCIDFGELTEIQAEEIELEENIRRTDLSWQEKAVATRRLYALRRKQAEAEGQEPPSIAQFTADVKADESLDIAARTVRRDIILSNNLSNPLVAKAKTPEDAFKALKREEELKRSEELAKTVGATLTAQSHVLIQGDCLEAMVKLPEASFDVILTDPPYGMGADHFGDSGGATQGAHFYDDSYESWKPLLSAFLAHSIRLSKPQAHLYVFCDIDRFAELRQMARDAGWETFRTPLIWVNPTSNRAPWPEHGPHRKWQSILYAIRGKRPVTKLYPDVITVPSDVNLNHNAQKPVHLYSDLLARSIRPGDSVLDPFCGTGPIFPAAHSCKCRATGIELNTSAAGIAVARIRELK